MKTAFSCFRLAMISSAALALSSAGCLNDNSPPKADPPIPVAASQKAATHTDGLPPNSEHKALHVGPFEKAFDGIRFSVPSGWKEVELAPSQQGFIDARFQIPTPHGDVTLTCSSNAGGIQTNIQRWIGQFQLPAGQKPTVEPIDVGGKSATWVDLEGEFSSGPMAGNVKVGAPVERMLGVAVPLGTRDFYLKLTGSASAVAAIRTPFRDFVRDARVGP